MHVARLVGILSVSSRQLIRVPRLPVTRLQLCPCRSYIPSSTYSLFQTISLRNRRRGTTFQQIIRPFRKSLSTSTRMEPNGHTRHKRKGSPVNTHERPVKIFKPERSNKYNSEHEQSTENQYIYNTNNMIDAMDEPITATGENAEWQATIEEVVKTVVSIHFCQTCSFDTSPALSSEATGFVVDAKKGYILTNRHVVGSGPFWGYCIFDNHEEVGIAAGSDSILLTVPLSVMYTLSTVILYTTSASCVSILAK